MDLIHEGEVQYFTCLYTSQLCALEGERGNPHRSQPIFQLLSDDTRQEFRIKIMDVLAAKMRSNTAKPRTDIYFLKPGAEQLQSGLQTLLAHITTITPLDRGDRSPRDPKANYDNTGLALEIDSLEAWVKANAVYATFAPNGFTLECIRQRDTTTAMPRVNIEVEKYKSRLHLGVEVDWLKTNILSDQQSSLIIDIPWTECGHLLGAVNNAIPKLK